MKRALLALLLLLAPLPALAGTATYNGNIVVPTGATLTIQGQPTGCVLLNSSGQAYGAICPNGTGVFSGSLPIVLTGSGPYVVSCPTCAVTTNTAQTFLGATTFSSAVTFNAAVTNNGSLSVTGPVDVGKTGLGVAGDVISSRGASTAKVWLTSSGSVYLDFGLTTASAFTFAGGNLYAPAFFTTSLRAHKTDIHPLAIDALTVLRSADWASFRYLPKFGDPREQRIGFIADDTPSILSGPKHDHFDLQAVSTVNAQAILQLETRLTRLSHVVVALLVIVAALVAALVALRR